MELLLDTHAFIWFINGDDSLPCKVKNEIKDVRNKCFLSIASLWEIAIKTSLGKLELKSDFNKLADFLSANEIDILPITFEHLQKLLNLKYHHRDPFDRIIISQGITDKLTVLTKDENFKKYRVKIMWE
ncbi:type II toxin-antitoxin system VapC family toxin [Rufibacter sp. XAAS-G3-1]|uniref:type II toxin-antitoxin system VapC family toxin n=1 Tax=Rufibacter sp. XAAS-G3-1 TaxID=2729134 RepID=UPI0015E6E3AE|nr:type II toxin-antitoxin system VapC family toxin [Rufibacter sp. XAAS-G3-1]